MMPPGDKDRMPGRYLMPCHGEYCGFPETGCSGRCGWGRGHTTSWRSKKEKRTFRGYVRWLLGKEPEEPFVDASDCVHGCNGDCVISGSDRCDFTCHSGRILVRTTLDEEEAPCFAGVYVFHPSWGPEPCPRVAERLVITDEGDLPLCVEHFDFVCSRLEDKE